MKKPFYKLKRFYIPCIILIIILAVLAKLLYSPLYTIYWGMYHFPKKEQEFRIFEKMTLNPSPKDMIKIVDDYQPKLEDFRDLNTKMQKAIFDFKVAKFFGFEDRYFEVSLKSYISLFIFLHGKEHTYFNYLNFISDLNSNEKQKYLNLRASTKDLEKQIFEEKLKFIKHYEEFYDYLDSIGYLNKGSWYKTMAIYPKITIRGLLLFHNNQLCSSKDTNFIFQNMKENYNIFNNLDPNSSKLLDKTLGKEWKDYRKNVSIFIEDTINKIQKALDECK
ncbi:Abi family protein [Campylobacter sp. CNRCH_2013_0898h]|uniref:Abi family protein n=1 Tax=Campylobacter sp. CNRCH_2013_0898h TaxID=2911601 RepID=UPI0021E699C1|nr:Abi family protein [Campylobacter sp. CNRCH_2013_0898h]MCV3554108.1 Abi family protein [Campylobacter sp. CNRCH_2013_0898h]